MVSHHASERMVGLCWALVQGWTPTIISIGCKLLAELARTSRVPAISNLSIARMVQAAFDPMEGLAEHRMFQACKVLNRLARERDVVLRDFLDRSQLERYVSVLVDETDPGAFSAPHFSDYARLLLLECASAHLALLSAEVSLNIPLGTHWGRFVATRVMLLCSIRSPALPDDLALLQRASICSLFPFRDDRLVQSVLTRAQNLSGQTAGSWPVCLIPLSFMLAALPTDGNSLAEIDSLLSVAKLLRRESGLSSASSQEDILDFLDDAENTMPRIQQSWLWLCCAVCMAEDCFASATESSHHWAGFSRALRRSSRLSATLPRHSPQKALLQSTMDSLFSLLSPPTVLRVLQHSRDPVDSEERAVDRAFLLEWALLHFCGWIKWQFSFSQSPHPRPTSLPITVLSAIQANVEAKVEAKSHENGVSVVELTEWIEESRFVPLCLELLESFIQAQVKSENGSVQSRSAEQVRYSDSLVSIVLYAILCRLERLF